MAADSLYRRTTLRHTCNLYVLLSALCMEIGGIWEGAKASEIYLNFSSVHKSFYLQIKRSFFNFDEKM